MKPSDYDGRGYDPPYNEPAQGSESSAGLGAIVGKWPGDETDEEILKALKELDNPLGEILRDMENTLQGIADPTDYEGDGDKSAELCRKIALDCLKRHGLSV